jgi:DMSO/TMAO reductase YedYZ molybdopterin-dependent catalytic subunit
MMKKIIPMVGIVLCMILLGGAIVQGSEEWNVTLVGNETKIYNLTEIKEMPSYENGGAFLRSTGAIVGPHNYKGVNMTYLLDLVGGVNSSQSMNVTASDGYSITFSYDQVMGNITTYNETGEAIDWSKPITMMLAYEEDGDPIHGGPLRIVYVGDECDGQYPITDGHFWVKWVTEIEVQETVEEWDLTLTGVITEVMDRATFESGANCHGISWTDDKDRTWRGIPLWLLVGRVDDEIIHGDGAFNDELCEEGYNVTAISSDNYTVTFNSTFVGRNDDLIVANRLNGTALNASKYGHLRLVGPALEGHHKLKRVVEIRLTDLPSEFTDTSIAVVGKVNNSLNLSLSNLKAMNTTSVTVMPHCPHEINITGEGPFTYRGVLLRDILDQADVIGGYHDRIHYVILVKATDGYVASIAYGELGNPEIFGYGHILLAYERDGEPLSPDEGPVRLIVPTDYYQGRWVKWVYEIDVEDALSI